MWAFKNKHQYQNIDLDFTVSGNGTIALAVHDQRTEMLTTGKTPSFVGYMRSGVGIPYPIHTESGNALADDIAGDLAKAFTKRGFTTTLIQTAPAETHEQVVTKLKAVNALKSLILHIDTWHTDCYQMVWCNYKIVLQVYDATGKFLGQKMLEGTQDLGGSFWNPPKHAKKVVPAAFKAKMEELFNSPEIIGFINI
jgi:hypothetical protein